MHLYSKWHRKSSDLLPIYTNVKISELDLHMQDLFFLKECGMNSLGMQDTEI